MAARDSLGRLDEVVGWDGTARAERIWISALLRARLEILLVPGPSAAGEGRGSARAASGGQQSCRARGLAREDRAREDRVLHTGSNARR